MNWQTVVTRCGIVLAGVTAASSSGVAQPAPRLSAFAYSDCGPSATPTTRIVLVQGPAPDAMPAKPPRPSIEIVVNAPVDKLPTGPLTVSPDALKGGPNAAMVSCPVVGSCAPAQSGSVTVQRTADGDLTGEYRGQWSQGQPRTGKFSAGWRDSKKTCG